MKFTILVLVLLCVCHSERTSEAIADQVSSLPEYYNFTSDF